MEPPAPTTLTPQQAWQVVLDQLRTEMQRADFDTWVKSVEFVSFDKGVFTLGTHNAYGRGWLDSRIKVMAQRQLGGILGRPVMVEFVVLNAFPSIHDEVETDHDPVILESSEDSFLLQVLHDSVRNVLIEPERVVKLPVYFLRWLPYVDAEIIFLVMALRQEYYLSTSGKSNASGKVTGRAERICQWAGISRAQFFRLMQPGSGFEWFGEKLETDYELDRRTGRTKKSPNKYQLYGIPLTPGDARDLKEYLRNQGIEQRPKEALLATLATQPKEILQYPVRVPIQIEDQGPIRLTVQDVVREIAGQKLTPDLIDLADRLSDHLLAPNEFILVSWYFLRYWLPLLGADAAMLILILRNACYFNNTTGEMRDEVWIEGGYESLARQLGLENARLISHWFPAAIERGRHKTSVTQSTQKEFERRAQFQQLMGSFAQRIDHRAGQDGSYSWKFKVSRSDPLIPAHEEIYQKVLHLVSDLDQQGLLDELMDRIVEQDNDCLETDETHSTIVLRRSNIINDCSETLANRLKDCLATLEWQSDGCFETLLKILKGFKDSYYQQDPSTSQDSSCRDDQRPFDQMVAAVTDAKTSWSLEHLLSRASEKQRSLLAKQEKCAVPFVSWLIHGAANPRIQNPYSLAISKLVETPRIGAGGASERLGSLPPEQLILLLKRRLSLSQSNNKDWEVILGNVNLDRVRLLVDTLNLPLDLLEVERRF